jgi:hypothetical protein
MKRLMLPLVLCAAAVALSAQADNQPSMAAIRAACAQDAQKFCAGVQPGGGRIVACLKQHKDSLSDGCKQVAGVAAAPSSRPAESAAPSSDSTPMPNVPAAPAKAAAAPKAAATKTPSAKTASSTISCGWILLAS